MTTSRPIDLSALSEQKQTLRLWTGVAIAGFLSFFILMGLSYFVLDDAGVTANTANYRKAEATLGFSQLACLLLAGFATVCCVVVRARYRVRVFRQFIADNEWSVVREHNAQNIAAVLLGPSTSNHDDKYIFEGKYRGRPFTCLIFQYLTERSQTRRFLCLSFRLPKSYPMLVIDNKLNDRGYRRHASNLPDRIPQSVSFELEGNFNEYYTISTTKGSERAATQILSPDVMAALVDRANNKVDIEIGDKDLFLIFEDDFYNDRNIKALFSVADTMLGELNELSETWLALSKWEEAMTSQTARAARHKLISKISLSSIILGILAFIACIFALVGNFMNQ